MLKLNIISLLLLSLLYFSCGEAPATPPQDSKNIIAVKNFIKAVNDKNADLYVANFSDSVEIYVDNIMRVKGKSAIKNNRAQHFKNHPNIYSEIEYLLEIDNKVILHDKVWLEDRNQVGQDIVEIFLFEHEKIIRIDVIQPRDLLNR